MPTPARNKKDQLAALKGSGSDLENRLFFAARNLAIEALALRLENHLLRKGFPTQCGWSESSFGAPTIYVRMLNPKPTPDGWEYGQCTLRLTRERIGGPSGLSQLYYSLASIETSEYWRGRQPAQLLAFRAEVQALHDSGHLAAEVDKVNYPFDYTSHSSF